MEPPVEPNQEDCCNSGCNPCIFDVYEQQLKLFRRSDKEFLKAKNENGISEVKYTTFTVIRTRLLCGSTKELYFKQSKQSDTEVWWRPGDHFLYKYNSDSLSCTRPYTPIKLISQENEDFDFSVVVKRYKNGLVSNNLFNLKEGALTLWRGPYGSYTIEPNKFSRIVMIAQGTGIAPFISIIDRIVNNEDDMTTIFLFFCCRSFDEILFRDELNMYRSYWNFSYEVFLTQITNTINIKYKEPIQIRRFSYEDFQKLQPYSNNQFLICGSTKFMKTYSDALQNECNEKDNIILF